MLENCKIFAEFPMELPNGCCIGDCLLFTPFLPYVIGYNTMPFVNTILSLYNHSNTSLPSVKTISGSCHVIICLFYTESDKVTQNKDKVRFILGIWQGLIKVKMTRRDKKLKSLKKQYKVEEKWVENGYIEVFLSVSNWGSDILLVKNCKLTMQNFPRSRLLTSSKTRTVIG